MHPSAVLRHCVARSPLRLQCGLVTSRLSLKLRGTSCKSAPLFSEPPAEGYWERWIWMSDNQESGGLCLDEFEAVRSACEATLSPA